MTQFIAGKTYVFEVADIREDNEVKYIYLSDGERETYRVKPYDYQLEWEVTNLQGRMECYVKSVDIWGLPTLQQVKQNVLEECYSELNSKYTFKVIGLKTDEKTNSHFYLLKDAFGLHHRHYPRIGEPSRNVGDIFSLVVKDIETRPRNSAFLQFRSIPSKGIKKSPSSTPEDPRKESVFGYEDECKEFKSSIVFPAGGITDDIDQQILIIMKTIAGFQNHKGGNLYLGVNDSGEVNGINNDFNYLNRSKIDNFSYPANKDGFENKIRSSVKRFLGSTSNSSIKIEFSSVDQKEYCLIAITEVKKPIFLNNQKLYQRAGNMTQLLKGDEITYFVEERFLQRNDTLSPIHPVENKELEEVMEDDEEVPTAEIETSQDKDPDPIEIPEINKVINDKVWYYLTLYRDGGWSFQNKALETADVELEFPIMNTMKRERILMVYENGRVNVVNPYEIIRPKGSKGRKLRSRGKIYKNGWNTKSNLLSIFSAREKDLVVFESEDKEGTKWVKAHSVSAISEHTSLSSEGNVLINERLGAKILKATPLELNYYHLISSIVLKDNQTSGYLGYKITDRNFKNTFKTLDQLIEKLG